MTLTPVPGYATTWARGADLSKWNGPYDATKEPLDFILQRISAADGAGHYLDQRLEPLYLELAPVPVLAGWHFWSGFQPMMDQVADYVVGVHGKRHSSNWLDWEIYGKNGVLVNPLTVASANGAGEWIDRVAQATGHMTGAYIQRSDYQKLVGMKVKWIEQVPLWIKYWPLKQYLAVANFEAICALFPVDPDRMVFQQYGGDTGGVAGYGEGSAYGLTQARSIDLDIYHGTVAQLHAKFNIAPTPEPDISDAEKLRRLWEAHPELHGGD